MSLVSDTSDPRLVLLGVIMSAIHGSCSRRTSRPLRSPVSARRGRNGRSLQSPRHAPGPHCRDQDLEDGVLRKVRARGTYRCQSQSSEHLPTVRLALPEGGSYLMMPALARPQWRTWTSAILAGCVIAGGAFGAARMIRRTPDRLV